MPPLDSKQMAWFSAHLLPHEKKLRAWLTGRYPEADDIEDIIQDSYVRVLQVEKKEAINSPKSFLYRTARNLVLDQLRSHRKSRTISMVETSDSDVVLEEETSVEEVVCREQEYEILKMAIESLPPRCREILVMHKLKGMPQKDVAEALGISIHTVAGQLATALRKCTEFAVKYRNEFER